jgi:hypothetical protein
MKDLYYAIVGTQTNTNEGLGRLLGAIIVFILVFGSIFWALG